MKRNLVSLAALLTLAALLSGCLVINVRKSESTTQETSQDPNAAIKVNVESD